jgi:hypothetical protein
MGGDWVRGSKLGLWKRWLGGWIKLLGQRRRWGVGRGVSGSYEQLGGRRSFGGKEISMLWRRHTGDHNKDSRYLSDDGTHLPSPTCYRSHRLEEGLAKAITSLLNEEQEISGKDPGTPFNLVPLKGRPKLALLSKERCWQSTERGETAVKPAFMHSILFKDITGHV